MESRMSVITAGTIRGIVQEANHRGIQKNQVVALLKEEEQYVLVYYADIEEEY